MNLFIIYIGGSHSRALIELHDIRFVIANSIEETYAHLQETWWGVPESLHIDAWGILKHVDGHDIHLSTEPPACASLKRLYFVNLGGYDSKQFTELHKNILVIAANEIEAKQKAVNQIQEWESPHRDYLYDLDNIILVNAFIEAKGHFLHFTEQKETKPFEFECRYNPIGKIKRATQG